MKSRCRPTVIGLLLVVGMLLIFGCTPSRVDPVETGWLRWDRTGSGTLLAEPAGSSSVIDGSDSTQDVQLLSVEVDGRLDGLDVEHAVDIYIDGKTRLTVDGEPSKDFRYRKGGGIVDVPQNVALKVDFDKRGPRLVARSIDASTLPGPRPSGRGSFDRPTKAQQESWDRGPRPLEGSVVESEVAYAVSLAEAHPDEWLYVGEDGSGFVRGSVHTRQLWGDHEGLAFGEVAISRYERVGGIVTQHSVTALLDAESMVVRGRDAESVMQRVLSDDEWRDVWVGTTQESLYVVERSGKRLKLRVAVLDFAQR